MTTRSRVSARPFMREELFERPPPPRPSPGPWTVKGPVRQRGAAGHDETVWIVLDANSKCVAECDHQVDALFIAQNGPAA